MLKGTEVPPVVIGVIIAVVVALAAVAVWRATTGPGKVRPSADRIEMMKQAVARSHPPAYQHPMGLR